jgi:ketosteroid isomerase-like protein
MEEKSSIEVVRAFWKAFAARDLDTATNAYMSDDCDFVLPGAPPMKGREAVRAMFDAYVRAFPDFRAEPLHEIEHGDTYASETAFRGTHRGPLATAHGELPPTGREVAWRSGDIVRVRDGRIVSWHAYHDTLPLLAQLGVALG